MRIALCLSGQSKFIEEGYSFFLKNLIDFKDIDVFVHTWEDNQHDKVLSLYEPKDYIIEPQRYDITFNNKNLDYRQENANSGNFVHYSMFYSIKKSNELKLKYETENNFKYDCVIKSRFDVILRDKLDVISYDLSYINSPDVCGNPNVISDWFNFSNSHNMDNLSFLHNQMPIYEHQGVMITSGEELITHHLRMRQMNYKKINVNVNLIRDESTDIDIPNWISVKKLGEI